MTVYIQNGKVSSSLSGRHRRLLRNGVIQTSETASRLKQSSKRVHSIRRCPSGTRLYCLGNESKNFPTRWIDKLSEWRGVYFIFDAEDGKGYVGSASGKDNLFGRWKDYADTGDGGNVLLRKPRRPDKFVFSILELVSPNAETNAVENNWKIACIRAKNSAALMSIKSIRRHASMQLAVGG